MDIFEKIFGEVLSDDDVRQLIFLRNNGLLRTSYKGDLKLKPNYKQLELYSRVMKDVYKLAETDSDIKIIPPDITPDTVFRIYLEVPFDMSFSGTSLEILKRILPNVSVFDFGIKDEELRTDYKGEVETISFGFVVPDVYIYPFYE